MKNLGHTSRKHRSFLSAAPILTALLVLSGAGQALCQDATAKTGGSPGGRPVITKRGTIDCDMVEVSPIVFRGRLYRFEYVRAERYKENTTGDSYFRFRDVETGEMTPGFGKGYHLGSAFVDRGAVHVVGTSDWGGSELRIFRSNDLEHWESWTAWEKPEWKLFNTCVCRTGDGYVMAVEVGDPPEVVGQRFTMRFLWSPNLKNWILYPDDRVYTKDRYSACPAMHYLDGWHYMIYLEQKPVPKGIGKSWHAYASHIIRSRDLVTWESSPFNPILSHSPEDKKIANPAITPEQREHIAQALDLNNSDIDLCEYGGRTIIYYSWGDQHGTEFLAEAVYEGPLDAFLRGFFPE